MLRFLAGVVTAVLVSVSPSAGASPDEILKALDTRKQTFVNGLVEPVRHCVGREDTDHHLFNGCIDWHSSVHGFWALTAAARIGGRKDLGDYVRRELSPEAIELERAYMAKRPGFEMPYGRAWFLRLAIEFERAFDDKRLRAMADDMAQSLTDRLKAGPIDPSSASYGSQSWALINLRAYGRHTKQVKLVEFVDGIVETHFEGHDAPCAARADERRRSFMAMCTNWAWLVSETMEPARFKPWLEDFLPDPMAIAPVANPANAHLYGLNFSRAWGLWRLWQRSGDERYLKLYRSHLEPTFDTSDWWRGDYRIVGHWVAQFGMFAVMPLFEPDYF